MCVRVCTPGWKASIGWPRFWATFLFAHTLVASCHLSSTGLGAGVHDRHCVLIDTVYSPSMKPLVTLARDVLRANPSLCVCDPVDRDEFHFMQSSTTAACIDKLRVCEAYLMLWSTDAGRCLWRHRFDKARRSVLLVFV